MPRTSHRAEIRRRLRVQRTSLDLSQIETARAAKMSESKYWRIENGHDEASEEEQIHIAKALKSTVQELFGAQEAVAS